MTITQLVTQAQAGSRAAFGELYESLAGDLYRMALYTLGSQQDAEDAVADTFAEAWKGIKNLREPEAFRSWMFRILSARCKRQVAQIVTRKKEIDLDSYYETAEEAMPETATRRAELREALGTLSPEERQYLPELRPVCVLAGGVLGQTGMESAELLEAVCRQVKPEAVVAVDALACAALSRLGTTIQMSDSGISPGSGVANHRAELSKRTLGVPVVALGVPTVVDLHTAVQEVYGRRVPENRPNMMVTPRDVDRLIDHTGDLLACALNMALHPGMTFAQAEGLG